MLQAEHNNTLTWIHLSDLHYKKSDAEPLRNIRNALIRDLEGRNNIHAKLEKIDMIFFSGDLAYAGQREEFDDAYTEFLQKVQETLQVPKERVFIVPGNHDLNRDALARLSAKLRFPLSKANASTVTDWLNDPNMRRELLQPFQQYSAFVAENYGHIGSDSAYSYFCELTVNGIEVKVEGFNSALFCARPQELRRLLQEFLASERLSLPFDDYGQLFVGKPQLDSVVYKVKPGPLPTTVRIALVHHPFNWLAHYDRSITSSRLLNHFDFILHGHEHEQRAWIERGTRGHSAIIPAGAVFDRTPLVENRFAPSYNFVSLKLGSVPQASRGTVYLRRYDFNSNQFVADQDDQPFPRYTNGRFPLNRIPGHRPSDTVRRAPDFTADSTRETGLVTRKSITVRIKDDPNTSNGPAGV